MIYVITEDEKEIPHANEVVVGVKNTNSIHTPSLYKKLMAPVTKISMARHMVKSEIKRFL